MSIESAAAYIRRMRSDEGFRRRINDISDDEEASWAEIRRAGYDFTLAEFKAAQDELYREHGVSPNE